MFRAFQLHHIDPEEFYRKSPADREVIRAFIEAEIKMNTGAWESDG